MTTIGTVTWMLNWTTVLVLIGQSRVADLIMFPTEYTD